MAGVVLVVGGGRNRLGLPAGQQAVADLLGTAERLTDGDYGVKIEPDGPGVLRTLTTTFNEMAARFAASEDQGRRFLVTIVTSPPCRR